MTRNKIKFSARYNTEFIHELRAKVKEYFEKNNRSKYGNYNIVIKSLLMPVLCTLYINVCRSNNYTSVNAVKLDNNGCWNGWCGYGIDA